MNTIASLLIALPAVFMSSNHKEMCQVGVGDPLPTLNLRTGAGQSMQFEQLQGEKGTVIALHGNGGWMTDTLLADLGPEVADLYSSDGVRVVTISTNSVAKTPDGITAVRISKQEAEKTLGSGRMPRVYVLDSDGKIVWFDIEYSLSTRRELQQAIKVLTSGE